MTRAIKLMCVVAAFAVTAQCSLFAGTYTWKAGDGTFSDSSNWDPEGQPGVGDDVVIPKAAAAYTVTVSTAFKIGSLTVGGGAEAAAPTINFDNGLTTNEVTGSVYVHSGTLTHTAQPSTADTVKKALKLKVGGNMTVASGAIVDANAKGFYKRKGPGTTSTANQGASHGGLCNHADANSQFTKCYGSIREPVMPGSGPYLGSNANYAGGVIYLDVTGTLLVNGTIRADQTYQYAASGSVFLKTGTLSGSGVISTYGGAQYGGGGRIAVYQRTAMDWSSFSGTINASPNTTKSSNTGGAGTVYLECAADAPRRGELRLVSPSGTLTSRCALSSTVTDADEPFGSVVVGARTRLYLPEGRTLTVTKRFENNGTFTMESTSSVVLAPPSGGTCTVCGSGTLSFSNLSCSAPGGTVAFAAGKTFSIASGGSLVLSGSADSKLALVSTEPGSRWTLSLASGVAPNISDVAVSDSEATSVVSATSSTDGGNNVNWAFTGAVVPGEENRWTGATDTDWSKAANWSLSRAPEDTDSIVIPNGCENYPSILFDTTVNSITNESNARVTLAGGSLTVTNAIKNLGAIVYSGGETLYFRGDGAQVAILGSGQLSRVVVEKSGGGVRFEGGFSAGFFKCSPTGPVALSFSPGDTVAIGRLFLRGLKETEGVFSNLITLSSTTPGSPWLLDVEGGDYIVSGVNASDCNASAGVKIVAGALASDPSGSCVNWDVAALHAAEWTGLGGDNAFSTAENWHPCAPSSATRAIVSPTAGSATVNVSSPLDLGALVVGGGGGSATISFNNGLSTNVVAGDVYLLSGTLTHQATSDSSNAATHALFLSAGGDIDIAQSAAVNATAKGHQTRTGPDAIPNQGTSKYNGASHGGVGGGEGPYKGAMCYGSIKYPRTAGSGGNVGNAKGGGIVGLVAGGTLKLYGTISADVTYGYNSGGSVCIVADAILGSGSISANGGAYSGGGRVALHQVETVGWTGYTGNVTVSGCSAGTYYREDASGKSELYIGGMAGSSTASGKVQFPMAADGDAKQAYAGAALSVAANTKLMLTNKTWAAGSTVRVRDIDLVTSTSKADCLGSVIKVSEKTHKDGRNWGDTYEALVVENGGKIVWPVGLILHMR